MRVVYAVYGQRDAFDEMELSITSLRRWHPDANIEVFTTDTCIKYIKDNFVYKNIIPVHPRNVRWHDPVFKVSAILEAATSPFVFLDNDTYIAGSLLPAWELISKYDLLACLAPISDQSRKVSADKVSLYNEIPSAFSEINSGVLFVSNTARVHELLYRWRELVYSYPNLLGDQWRLRIAMYEINPHICILPNNYNYRIDFHQSVFGPVRILHGHNKNFKLIAEEINLHFYYRHIDKVGKEIIVRKAFYHDIFRRFLIRLRQISRQVSRFTDALR